MILYGTLVLVACFFRLSTSHIPAANGFAKALQWLCRLTVVFHVLPSSWQNYKNRKIQLCPSPYNETHIFCIDCRVKSCAPSEPGLGIPLLQVLQYKLRANKETLASS